MYNLLVRQLQKQHRLQLNAIDNVRSYAYFAFTLPALTPRFSTEIFTYISERSGLLRGAVVST